MASFISASSILLILGVFATSTNALQCYNGVGDFAVPFNCSAIPFMPSDECGIVRCKITMTGQEYVAKGCAKDKESFCTENCEPSVAKVVDCNICKEDLCNGIVGQFAANILATIFGIFVPLFIVGMPTFLLV